MRYMREQIAERLRSERGASLSVVLLLFLVCMVVSSIVLAAATATSGRQAELAAMDKRYYNVMSAQGLLWDEFNRTSYNGGTDNRIKIQRSCVIKRQPSGSYVMADDPAWQVSLHGEPLASGLYNPSGYTLLDTLAIDTVFPDSASQSLAANREVSAKGTFDLSDPNNPQFVTAPQARTPYNGVTTTVTNGTHASGSNLSKNLRTSIIITPTDNGDLAISLESATPDDRDTYRMQFRAQAQIDEDVDLVRIGADDTFRLTCTTYVSWDPTALEKGSGTS